MVGDLSPAVERAPNAGNGAAHALAHLAISSSLDRVWVEGFPECITGASYVLQTI
jgi:hypothetical protein